ncbi:helix-turn-helix transcriptional regulator [Nesterenkonia aerolata]|uniref:helix-turn-helix transcriptional regulator n=1 Tax=Nesterenkonia aerolata TaxID=3074079 RepID=UPI0035B5BDAC
MSAFDGSTRFIKSECSESRSDTVGALEEPRARVNLGFRDDDLLTTGEVAEWLRVSPSTLCRWRKVGDGPPVIWIGASCPRYERAAVARWLTRMAA